VSLARIRFESIEAEPGRQPAAEFAQSPQELLHRCRALYLEDPPPGYVHFDVITFLKSESIYHCARQAKRKTISPFRDPHMQSRKIYSYSCLYLIASVPRKIDDFTPPSDSRG
jgi:hypothetical protein